MKHRLSFLFSFVVVVGLSFGLPSLANHSSDQYSTKAHVISVERAGDKPIPTIVTWVQSSDAEDGDEVVLDHFEVVLLEDSIEIGRVSVDPDAYTLELNKKNIPGMKVYTDYEVQVDEMYMDGTSSEGYDTALLTAPPKLKNVRVANKEIENDELTITLKWRQPVNLKGESLYYDYKISNLGEPDQLIDEGSGFGDIHSIDIYDLPLKSMQIRVRARDNSNGEGQWSAWKKFHSSEAEAE